MNTPLVLHTLTDGRTGIDNQAIGLAEAVARLTPATVISHHVELKGRAAKMPVWWPQNPLAHLDLGIERDAPHIVIGCGRQSLYFTTRWKRRYPQSFVVQLQHPRCGLGPFDLVIPPAHDQLEGPKVLPIIGAPNRIHTSKMADALTEFPHLAALPHPRIAVLIGGTSKSHDLTPGTATQFASQLARLAQHGAQLMVTISRRTPVEAARILKHHLGPLAAVFYDNKGPNPYFAILAAADVVIATSDSTNMLTEAATAGKPVLITPIDGHSQKHDRLQAELINGGWARAFDGTAPLWTPPPFAETDRAAAEVLKRYHQWRGAESQPM
jgi:hypothetical protein